MYRTTPDPVELWHVKRKFKPYRLSEPLLLPPDICEWVPRDHLAHFIRDVITEEDLAEWYQDYESDHGRGQPPYPPVMMLRVILYCICTGRFSSRKIEAATYHDLAVRFLSCDMHPDFTKIAAFKLRHKARIEDLFVRVVGLCRKMNMVRLGHVSIDGTKLPANASLKKTVRMADLDKLIQKDRELVQSLLTKAAKADESGEEEETSMPRELADAQRRLTLLEAAKEEYDRDLAERLEGRERADAEWASRPTTAGSVRIKDLREQAGLTQQKLAELMGTSQQRVWGLESLKKKPNQAELLKLAELFDISPDDILRRVTVGKRPKEPESEATDRLNLTDPDSATIKPRAGASTIQGYNAQVAVDDAHQIIIAALVTSKNTDYSSLLPTLEQAIKNCGSRPSIVTADSGYCSVQNLSSPALVDIALYTPPRQGDFKRPHPLLHHMRQKLDTDEGRAIYNQRAAIVEPVFAHIKRCIGFSRFLYRSLEKVNTEWQLAATAHNLLKLFRYGR